MWKIWQYFFCWVHLMSRHVTLSIWNWDLHDKFSITLLTEYLISSTFHSEIICGSESIQPSGGGWDHRKIEIPSRKIRESICLLCATETEPLHFWWTFFYEARVMTSSQTFPMFLNEKWKSSNFLSTRFALSYIIHSQDVEIFLIPEELFDFHPPAIWVSWNFHKLSLSLSDVVLTFFIVWRRKYQWTVAMNGPLYPWRIHDKTCCWFRHFALNFRTLRARDLRTNMFTLPQILSLLSTTTTFIQCFRVEIATDISGVLFVVCLSPRQKGWKTKKMESFVEFQVYISLSEILSLSDNLSLVSKTLRTAEIQIIQNFHSRSSSLSLFIHTSARYRTRRLSNGLSHRQTFLLLTLSNSHHITVQQKNFSHSKSVTEPEIWFLFPSPEVRTQLNLIIL